MAPIFNSASLYESYNLKYQQTQIQVYKSGYEAKKFLQHNNLAILAGRESKMNQNKELLEI